MVKKFIKGTFKLEQNVTDLEAFEEPIKLKLAFICTWGDENDVAIRFGASDDNTYLCEYKVVKRTKQMCNGCVAELKSLLKEIFPKAQSIIQWSGDQLF